ncbi:MAG: ABC transporter permease [Dehalococcoidia bacterium]|nr:ABC transporter permease [Dehalococcoidia bacterium]
MTVWHLFIANLKMIFRNQQALFWALVFPLIFVVVFGLFRLDEPVVANLAVVDQAQNTVSRGLIAGLKTVELVKVDESKTLVEARRELEKGDIPYVLVIPPGLTQDLRPGESGQQPVSLVLLYDQSEVLESQRMFTIISRFVDQANLVLNEARPVVTLQPAPIRARQAGYFDFILPGLVGMGVMTYGVIGMATVLAQYRQQKILKRMLATPLSVRNFFTGLILANLVLAVVQAAIILAAGMLLFNGHVYGNFLWVFLLVILSNIVFLNLGFIVGSFAKTVEAANGLANVVAMPMMFFSGVFFGTDTLPAAVRTIVHYLPLSPMLEALRGVTLEARGFWEFPTEMGILGAWIVGSSVVAVRVFRFH